MYQTESHTVPELERRMRLSDYTRGVFKLIPSRKGMKKAIDKGWVRINNRQASTGDFIKGGELLTLEIQTLEKPNIELDLTVLYEDNYLAVIDKPAGIEVSGNRKWTVENALAENLQPSLVSGALAYPQPVHRLDHPTTGTLLVGKIRTTVIALNALFAANQVRKEYLAVTIGEMSEKGVVINPIEGKSSKSEFEVMSSIASDRFGQLNLVKLIPHTGRRHQLRKHFAEIGNPILGDKEYWKSGLILTGKGLYLHSKMLEFTHPVSNETVRVESLAPAKFLKLFP